MLKELRNALLPARMIVKVTQVNGDGTVTVTTDSGFVFNAIGTGTVDSYVYVQDAMVIGTASTLAHGVIDI